MRKKVGIGILVIVTVLCIVFVACTDSAKYRGAENVTDDSQTDFSEWADGTLMVNGKVCTDCFVKIHPDGYAGIPLLRIMRELGGTTEWLSNNKVRIAFAGTDYVLSPNKRVLEKERETFNLIAIAPGANHGIYYQISEEEFIIDSDSLCYFFSLLGIRAETNYDSATVSVYEINADAGNV